MSTEDVLLAAHQDCQKVLDQLMERATKLRRELAEARAALAANESQAWLGNATTKELLEELMARAEVGGYAKYRTVDIDDDSAALKAARGE